MNHYATTRTLDTSKYDTMEKVNDLLKGKTVTEITEGATLNNLKYFLEVLGVKYNPSWSKPQIAGVLLSKLNKLKASGKLVS